MVILNQLHPANIYLILEFEHGVKILPFGFNILAQVPCRYILLKSPPPSLTCALGFSASMCVNLARLTPCRVLPSPVCGVELPGTIQAGTWVLFFPSHLRTNTSAHILVCSITLITLLPSCGSQFFSRFALQ